MNNNLPLPSHLWKHTPSSNQSINNALQKGTPIILQHFLSVSVGVRRITKNRSKRKRKWKSS